MSKMRFAPLPLLHATLFLSALQYFEAIYLTTEEEIRQGLIEQLGEDFWEITTKRQIIIGSCHKKQRS